jgi:hypothetical protein
MSGGAITKLGNGMSAWQPQFQANRQQSPEIL